MHSFQLLSLATCLLSAGPVLAQATAASVTGHDHLHHDEAVELPAPRTEISIEGEHRVIRTNGIPDHPTGTFPNARNPNAIRAREDELRVPVNPVRLDVPLPAHGAFGVAVNGIAFDSGTAEFWTPDGRRRHGPQARPEGQRTLGGQEQPGGRRRPDGQRPRRERSEWRYEALGGSLDLGIDQANAHVQPPGKYHYHGQPDELVQALLQSRETDGPILVGWAADGYPIYVAGTGETAGLDGTSSNAWTSGYRLKTGSRPASPEGPGGAFDGTFSADWEYHSGLGTLDECNGASGITPEFPSGTYFYVVTDEYPYVPRFWRGQPDPSFGRPRDSRDQTSDRPARAH